MKMVIITIFYLKKASYFEVPAKEWRPCAVYAVAGGTVGV